MPPRSARYAGAVLAVLLAVVLRLAIDAIFGRPFPYLPFLLTVALANWFLGWLPGLLTLALSTAVLSYWTPGRLVGFIILSVMMALPIDFVQRTRIAARAASVELARHQASLRRAELTQAELAAIVA